MDVIDLYSLNGEKTGSVTVPTELATFKPNDSAVYYTLRGYTYNQAQGTASTKTRGEVRASNAKPWKQKGTGRARAGRTSSPVWRGGGVVFGPLPGMGAYKVNRKVRRQALKTVVFQKIQDSKFVVLESLIETEGQKPKTKKVKEMLKALKLDGRKAILLSDEHDEILMKSSRNIPGVVFRSVAQLNVYDVCNSEYIVTTKKCLESIKEIF